MEKLISEGITRSQTKGREITSKTLQVKRWIEDFGWTWVWDLSPKALLDALALSSTAQTILAVYERRTKVRIAALMVLEPYPGLKKAFHLHSLLQAPALNPQAFKAFSARWGQARVEPYRQGGGFAGYLARKIASGTAILDLYGTPAKKEVDNADWS